MAHIRQLRPDVGLGLQARAPNTFSVVLFSFGSGPARIFVESDALHKVMSLEAHNLCLQVHHLCILHRSALRF
jgi:hypothetical protein